MSVTQTVVLQPIPPLAPTVPAPHQTTDQESPLPAPDRTVHDAESALPPETAISTTQRWNDPPVNTFRLLSCYYAFLVYGINSGAPGAMVPILEEYYSLPHSVISIIFLSPMFGCLLASFTSNRLHAKAGRRGVAMLSTGSYIVAHVGLSLHPPFGVAVCLFVFIGFGSGLMNGSWNSWVGGLVQGSTLLGFLHGFWGAGATLAPIIASALAARGYSWWVFYYLMCGMTVIAVISTTLAFWSDSGAGRRMLDSTNTPGLTLAILKDKVTLMLSAFMLLYVGAEVTIGGWLLTFMINVRKGTPSASSLVASGFWIGITAGRFALGWFTGYVGEKPMVLIYLLIAIGLELGFWLGQKFVVSAIMSALVGLSIGMIMPAGIRMMTKLLPPEKHIVSVGFATSFAVTGSAIFPFAVGALAQAYGVQVLQPVILALFGLQLIMWLPISRGKFKA